MSSKYQYLNTTTQNGLVAYSLLRKRDNKFVIVGSFRYHQLKRDGRIVDKFGRIR